MSVERFQGCGAHIGAGIGGEASAEAPQRGGGAGNSQLEGATPSLDGDGVANVEVLHEPVARLHEDLACPWRVAAGDLEGEELDVAEVVVADDAHVGVARRRGD